jgi:hypothetical protein
MSATFTQVPAAPSSSGSWPIFASVGTLTTPTLLALLLLLLLLLLGPTA